MSDGEVLSSAEIEKILSVTPGDTPIGLRNRALLVGLFADGLRIKEIIGMTAAEAEWEDFAPAYRNEINPWMRQREELGFDRFEPFFTSLEGEALTPAYVRGLVRKTRAAAVKG